LFREAARPFAWGLARTLAGIAPRKCEQASEAVSVMPDRISALVRSFTRGPDPAGTSVRPSASTPVRSSDSPVTTKRAWSLRA